MSDRFVVSKALRELDAVEKALNTYISSDRARYMQGSGVRAGGSRRSSAVRRGDNIGTKHGEIRLGAKGKSYNTYNAKSGTWEKGVYRFAPKSKPSAEPPNQARKAPGSAAASKKARMGYNYTSAYNKPTNPYMNRGASIKNVKAGQPKAIRPSGGPTRFSRSSKKK